MASLPPGMNCKHRIKKNICKGKGLYSWITSHTHRCDKNTNFFQHYINPTTQFKTASGLVEGRGANPSQNPPHPPPLPQKSSDFGHFEIGFFRGRIFFSFLFLFFCLRQRSRGPLNSASRAITGPRASCWSSLHRMHH